MEPFDTGAAMSVPPVPLPPEAEAAVALLIDAARQVAAGLAGEQAKRKAAALQPPDREMTNPLPSYHTSTRLVRKSDEENGEDAAD